MLFSSIIFIFYFFPITFLVYFFLSFSRKLQNIWLLAASLFFYAWGESKYVFLLLGSIVFNTIVGLLVEWFRTNKKVSKCMVTVACIVNIGSLFIFKYVTFVVDNINLIFETKLNIGEIRLPLGISFFTFQAISYVVDVYRNDAKAEKNLFNVGLYIALFPQLIAGPIVRYATIAEQIRARHATFDKFSVGMCRFITGFGKKIIIANNMALVADYVYKITGLGSVSVITAWLGSIAYTLQIFFDFSAYSDMAIGLGLIFGFELEENFNYPYISTSVTEFWRRWHISLTTWFKDYVYFPLGGSRVKNKDIMVRNIFIVWFLTGIWHGAGWNFIMWGMLNFFAIMIERFFGLYKIKEYKGIRRFVTLLLINFGWVLFRAMNIKQANNYLGNMFGVFGNQFYSADSFMLVKEYGIFFLFAIIFSTPVAKRYNKVLVEEKCGFFGTFVTMGYPFVIVTVFLICIMYLVKGSYNPFIYFNF